MRAAAIIIASVVLLAVVFGSFWANDDALKRKRLSDAYHESAMQDLKRSQLAAKQELELAQARATLPATIVGSYIWVIGLSSGVVLLVSAGAVYALRVASGRTYEQHREMKDLQLRLDASVRTIEAISRPAPVPYNYAPHISVSSQTPQTSQLSPELPLGEAGERAQTFAGLLNSHQVGSGNPLLLGYGEAGMVHGSWLDLYSTAVGGLPGTGKTTSQRFFACQTALHGARFVVCDPHYGSSDDSLGSTLEELSVCFECNIASEEHAILEAVRYVDSVGKARKTNGNRQPLILWIDETTALLNSRQVGGELAMLMEEVARQYRKFGVYLSASGQNWLASRSGGDSALRDSFASSLVHRMRRNQARLLVPSDDAKKAERLETGQAILYRTSGQSEIVRIPNTTQQDVIRVAGLVARSGNGQDSESTDIAPQRGVAQSPQDARILELLKSGKTPQQVTRDLSGAKSGRSYNDMLATVNEVIHRAIGGY